MVPLARIEERTFSDGKELSNFLRSRKRLDLETPIKGLSVTEEGVFRSGRIEGALTGPALCGLAGVLRIPEGFAFAMPPDLLAHVIGRLSRDKRGAVRVHSEEGLVTGIMPAEHLPVHHQLVVDRTKPYWSNAQAYLGPNYLRITTLSEESRLAVPGDGYQAGWEIRNFENGLGGLEARRYLLRMICLNGLVGFDTVGAFSRKAGSREPIAKSLEGIGKVIREQGNFPELERATRWATERRVGNQLKPAVDFLAGRLEGETTRRALGDVTLESNWYDLLNGLTSFARTRPGETRRRYEALGGQILNWFMREGRGRVPWQRMPCEQCMRTTEVAN